MPLQCRRHSSSYTSSSSSRSSSCSSTSSSSSGSYDDSGSAYSSSIVSSTRTRSYTASSSQLRPALVVNRQRGVGCCGPRQVSIASTSSTSGALRRNPDHSHTTSTFVPDHHHAPPAVAGGLSSSSTSSSSTSSMAVAAASYENVHESKSSMALRSSSTSTSSSPTVASRSLSSSYTGAHSDWNTSAILAKHGQSLGAGVVSAPPNASLLYEPRRQFSPYVALGPIIGMVTETTARILIESSADTDIRCFLTDAYGVQHGALLQCPKNRPVVFVFAELRPDTKYKVSFDLPVPGLVKSSFKTLATQWGEGHAAARFAVVSSNNYQELAAKIPHADDLWKKLYQEHARSPFNYCLHLGNVAFVDNQDYVDTKEGRLYSEYSHSVFNDVLEFCDELSPDIMGSIENHVCEMIRNVYRDTWNQPCVRHCLANMPNLMITGTMELGQSFNTDDDTDTSRQFAQRCAYKVYNEYCRALFEDVSGPLVKIGQAYHFHAFGDIGIVFLDTKAHSLFHRCSGDSRETPFLGRRQWADLDYSLSDKGYLSACKVLLICTPSPVAQVGESVWMAANDKGKLDLTETWNTAAGVSEASLLLSKLFDWRNRRQGRREVILLGGSITDGGLTSIHDRRYERGIDFMKQIVTGCIGNRCRKSKASLSKASMNNGIGVYHTFKHNRVVRNRSYATVEVRLTAPGSMAEVETGHVVSKDGKGFIRMEHKI